MVINIAIGSASFFNTRALLFPFIRFSKELKESNIKVNICDPMSGAARDCDILILDSKAFRSEWQEREVETLEKISELCGGDHKTLWFNTGDSSGGIQRQVIDLVDRYFKGQLLRERSLYSKNFYGGRIYTDYYFREDGVRDSAEIYSPVLTDAQISKLRVSWNLGMNPCMDYWTGIFGRFVRHPRYLRFLRHRLADRGDKRSKKHGIYPLVNSRMSVNYARETVSYQRKMIVRQLRRKGIKSGRVKRKTYFSDLQSCKFAVSPFGWGEVCIRDFEAILCRSILIKPDMSHIETWPDVYLSGKTYLPFSWDLGEFDEWFEDTVVNYSDREDLAEAAFSIYAEYVGKSGAEKFIEKIDLILQDLGVGRY